jgi:hypothetical protein
MCGDFYDRLLITLSGITTDPSVMIYWNLSTDRLSVVSSSLSLKRHYNGHENNDDQMLNQLSISQAVRGQ